MLSLQHVLKGEQGEQELAGANEWLLIDLFTDQPSEVDRI